MLYQRSLNRIRLAKRGFIPEAAGSADGYEETKGLRNEGAGNSRISIGMFFLGATRFAGVRETWWKREMVEGTDSETFVIDECLINKFDTRMRNVQYRFSLKSR